MDDDEKTRLKALRREVMARNNALRDELLQIAESMPEAVRSPLAFLDDDAEKPDPQIRRSADPQAAVKAEDRPEAKKTRSPRGIISHKGAAALEEYMSKHKLLRNIDVAHKHRLSETTVSRIRESHRVELNTWRELAKIIGVPLEDILD